MKLNCHPQTIPLFFPLYMQLDFERLERTRLAGPPNEASGESTRGVWPNELRSLFGWVYGGIYQTL